MYRRANHTKHPNTLNAEDFYPSSFTGKEKDEETGYGYFGARYLDYELTGMWLSVDPLADKYPGISPYAYCAWNPVKLVDPDGRDTSICYTPTEDNQKTMNYARRHYSYDRSDILHHWSHGSEDYLVPFGYVETPDESAPTMSHHINPDGTRGEKHSVIVLHSCDVGKGNGCFAEKLSKLLPDIMIFAPSDKLAVSDKFDKEYVVANGFWNVYYGGLLVNICSGTAEATQALQFIWENVPAQTIIEIFSQRNLLIACPQVIKSNYIQETLSRVRSHMP